MLVVVFMFVMMLVQATFTMFVGMRMCHIFAVSKISRCKDTAHFVQLGCKDYYLWLYIINNYKYE